MFSSGSDLSHLPPKSLLDRVNFVHPSLIDCARLRYLIQTVSVRQLNMSVLGNFVVAHFILRGIVETHFDIESVSLSHPMHVSEEWRPQLLRTVPKIVSEQTLSCMTKVCLMSRSQAHPGQAFQGQGGRRDGDSGEGSQHNSQLGGAKMVRMAGLGIVVRVAADGGSSA